MQSSLKRHGTLLRPFFPCKMKQSKFGRLHWVQLDPGRVCLLLGIQGDVVDPGNQILTALIATHTLHLVDFASHECEPPVTSTLLSA